MTLVPVVAVVDTVLTELTVGVVKGVDVAVVAVDTYTTTITEKLILILILITIGFDRSQLVEHV